MGKSSPSSSVNDFRRTAVRNLARIGVDRKTAMEMVGHETESIYRRYTITDETILRDASARLAGLHEAEREENSQSLGVSTPEPPQGSARKFFWRNDEVRGLGRN
ncbi:MAG TPA: hypothetical protein VKI41_02265 [Vicinamibacteria bacterium]|nr:hypothetical protein [Vicinamibacteria bacterium]